MTHVAYLVSRYPAISHTFVLREVVALRELGFEVATYSIRRTERSQLLAPEDRDADATTRVLVPPTAAHVAGVLWLTIRHLPAVLSMFRFAQSRATPGWRGRVWQVFYAVEALLLHDSMRRRGIRHVHAHFANVGADVARLCAHVGSRITGEPWTWSFTMHGSTEFYNVRAHGLADKVVDAELVVCISDFTKSQLQMLVPPATWPSLHVVRCGIQPDRFRPADRRPAEGHPEILYVGRLVPEKGPLVLVEAMRILRDRGVDAHATLIGEGPHRAELEEAIERAGLADRITLVGAVGHDEIPSWYEKADVFCLPSFAEGVPVVLMEAMACGLPVVTSAITGVPELVRDGISGLLVTPSRADQLADALAALATDPERRVELGRAGRATVVEQYDIDRNVPALAGLLRSVAG